eukprot:TRINITY_DN13337_c0_g1_i1.p1 TRINITY_DN13337_c0_g1~~TRINITY_DN13337_c0_g1_i1.p1  ORF type:complete len:358 (-),score=90.31 TRINITY_DN13337_c0_g1_i1:119-1126(-)
MSQFGDIDAFLPATTSSSTNSTKSKKPPRKSKSRKSQNAAHASIARNGRVGKDGDTVNRRALQEETDVINAAFKSDGSDLYSEPPPVHSESGIITRDTVIQLINTVEDLDLAALSRQEARGTRVTIESLAELADDKEKDRYEGDRLITEYGWTDDQSMKRIFTLLYVSPRGLIAPHRRLVQEGLVIEFKVKQKRKKLRTLFLFNDALMVTKVDRTKKHWYRTLEIFHDGQNRQPGSQGFSVDDVMSNHVGDGMKTLGRFHAKKKTPRAALKAVGPDAEAANRATEFRFVTPTATHVFFAKTEEDKMEWVANITDVLVNCKFLNQENLDHIDDTRV